MRPYRRPTYIVALGGLAAALLLGGCAAVDEEAKVTPAQGSTTMGSASAENGEDSQSVAKVGDTLTLKGTAYKVTKVRTTTKVGSDFTEVNADGVFVVVNLTLTNTKDEPATILEDLVRLKGGNGKEYTTDLDAAFAVDNPLVLAEEIQPDLSKKLVAVYDVPQSAVAGTTLLVKDFWTDSTGQVDLGLS
jgi:hypothetical protein